MTKGRVIDTALFAPSGKLTDEQAKYIHGFVTAPWVVTAYQFHWNEFPEHREHYLRSYSFFKGWNPAHKANTNLKRFGAKTAPAPEPSTKARHC